MHPREKCAVFSAYSLDDTNQVARTIFYGLLSMQHRGQEASGICTYDTKNLRVHKGLGLVREVFSDRDLQDLFGPVGIGHNRYSTTGSTTIENVHPFLIRGMRNGIAIAHNGNLINYGKLRKELSKRGHVFTSSTDTEIIAHVLAIELIKNDLEAAVTNVMKKIAGAYSLVILTGEGELVAVRDPFGIRPLSVGSSEDAVYVSSESVGIQGAGGSYERAVEPGEILIMDEAGTRSL